VRSETGLSPHELVLLVLVAQRMTTPAETVSAYSAREDMLNAGFTEIASVLSARGLERRGFLESTIESNYNRDDFPAFRALDLSFEWLEAHQDQLDLRGQPPTTPDAGRTPTPEDFDHLPF
jgi:hypothetical protein